MKKIIATAILATAALGATAATAAETYWVKKGITLNARSGPSTYYDVIGKFHSCNAVTVISKQDGWSQVDWKGSYYWVSKKYLQDYKCTNGNSYKPKPKPKTPTYGGNNY